MSAWKRYRFRSEQRFDTHAVDNRGQEWRGWRMLATVVACMFKTYTKYGVQLREDP